MFSNYSMGEPSLRLYIKNLSKQATEDDLHYIFGRYIDWTSEDEKNMCVLYCLATKVLKNFGKLNTCNTNLA